MLLRHFLIPVFQSYVCLLLLLVCFSTARYTAAIRSRVRDTGTDTGTRTEGATVRAQADGAAGTHILASFGEITFFATENFLVFFCLPIVLHRLSLQRASSLAETVPWHALSLCVSLCVCVSVSISLSLVCLLCLLFCLFHPATPLLFPTTSFLSQNPLSQQLFYSPSTFLLRQFDRESV